MTSKEILNLVDSNGGATLHPQSLDPASIEAGYVVSIAGHEARIPQSILTPAVLDVLLPAYVKAASANAGYIGLWYDAGVVYVDVSVIRRSRGHALRFARQNGQQAIYDLAANKSIYVERTA